MEKASPKGTGRGTKTPLTLKTPTENSQDFFCDPDLGGLEFYEYSFEDSEGKLHSHEEYTFALTKKGQRYVNNGIQEVLVKTGDFLLINPREPHFGKPANNKNWLTWVLNPTENHFKTYLGDEAVKESYPRFNQIVVRDDKLTALFENIFNLLLTSKSPLEKENSLIMFFEYLTSTYSSPKVLAQYKSLEENEKVKKLKDFMQASLDKKISLDDLAQVVGLHPNYLVHAFKKGTGFTPHSYLLDLRIRKAKDLLKKGLPQAGVANEAGFFDQSHLNNYFKTILGMTPGEYQAAIGKEHPGSKS